MTRTLIDALVNVRLRLEDDAGAAAWAGCAGERVLDEALAQHRRDAL